MTTTTQSRQGHRPRVTGTRPLLVAAGAVLVVGSLAVVAAALAGGEDAAYAALAGSLVAGVVLLTGTFVVNVVASLMPAASLLIALMTYLLQVVLMGLAFLVLSDSTLTDTHVARTWLAVTVIACTGGWLAAQLWSTSRQRILAYDLPDPQRPRGEGGGAR